MSPLRPLMAGVLLLAVSSSALGPPNGTVGTLDFRYPDYIVDPLVPCPSEGYFPHPRDNTWFYRCYTRYSPSFFWRAYFQCPPCTVFSDALDQCVFWETGTQCRPSPEPCRKTFEDCRPVLICPAANSNRVYLPAIEVCFNTALRCPGQPGLPLCREGYVFDKTNRQCRVGTPKSPCLIDIKPTPIPFPIPEPTIPLTTTFLIPTPLPTTTTTTPTLPTTTFFVPTSLTTTTTSTPPTTTSSIHTPLPTTTTTTLAPQTATTTTTTSPTTTYPVPTLLPTTTTTTPTPPMTTSPIPTTLLTTTTTTPTSPTDTSLVPTLLPTTTTTTSTPPMTTSPVPTSLPPTTITTPTPLTTTSPVPTLLPTTTTTTIPPATTTLVPTPLPITFAPTPTITSPVSTLLPTTPERTPTNFVCQLMSPPLSAALNCSAEHLCHGKRDLKTLSTVSTGCQLDLKCDFSTPGGLQLDYRYCLEGPFHFYGNLNKCGGQDETEVYVCHQSSTTTTNTTTVTQALSITPPDRSFSPKDCTYSGQTLGVSADDVAKYCMRSCEDSEEITDSDRYCEEFLQCQIDQTLEFTLKPVSCQFKMQFDRKKSICIKIAKVVGSPDCIKPDVSTSSISECTFAGQLAEHPCDEPARCADGSLSVGGCKTFRQCQSIEFNDLKITSRPCNNPAMEFDKKTKRCVLQSASSCLGNINYSNATRPTPALYNTHTYVRYN